MAQETREPQFRFPFPPYAIQQQLMCGVYRALRAARPALLESPTGTGKSLSLCCSALQWLKDHEQQAIETLEKEIADVKSEITKMPESDDWLASEYHKIKQTQMLITLVTKFDKIKKRIENFKEMKVRVNKIKKNIPAKPLSCFDGYKKGDKFNDTPGNLEENVGNHSGVDEKVDGDLIIDVIEEETVQEQSDNEQDTEEDESVKIYISSRTHSQLSQFIGEIKRTEYGADTRVVTLASRQHFCINKDVTRLKNVNLINERCLDLQKSKTKITSVGDEGKILKKTKKNTCASCPYFNQGNITKLKERMLVDIMDMEDLVKSGKKMNACPYYASRAAMSDAQVVLVSHAGIVSSGARSGVSLKLNNNVLIIDEAHGLTSALEQAHSAPLSAQQLGCCSKYLEYYVNKYMAKLSSRNLLLLNQLLFVVKRLLGIIETKSDIKISEETKIFRLEDFSISAEIDHMNLRPLVEFCRNARLAPKLHGFSMRYSADVLEESAKKCVNKKTSLESFLSSISKKKLIEEVVEESKETAGGSQNEGSAGSSLYAILNFLEMLCNRSENGRILAYKSNNMTGQLKYLLLNPSVQFTEVVKQCRSVVLAGGTMEPLSEFHNLLTGSPEPPPCDRLVTLRCDHVVSPDNVLAVCLSKGPSNMVLNFSYEHRQSKELLDEVGRILRNISGVIPGGVVCFLPSYSYEKVLFDHLHMTRALELISKKKRVFREPKSAAQVDQVLTDFASAVRSKTVGTNGALLLSVVGGKLSEGLNFSDELGRCVVVVGMPYPNIKSPELQEKMSYLNRTAGNNAGSIYYENLCMKAVNQCIGRAVRHANDYACVLLLDERYSRPSTVASLPSFVKKSLRTNLNFGSTFSSIVKFFAKHKNNT